MEGMNIMKNSLKKPLFLIIALLAAFLFCFLPTSANALVVNTLEDITDNSDEFLSFREAVLQAGNGDTITFSEDLLSADEQKVITLTEGLIEKDDYIPDTFYRRPSFTIQGPGAERLAIKGNGNDQILRIYAFSLSLSGLSFIDTISDTGSVLRFNGEGTLTVEDCVFSGNSNFDRSHCKGVVIDSSNSIIRNCIFTNNTAMTSGGALYIYKSSGNHLVDGCTFDNNDAPVGGAIVVSSDGSDVVIRNSTFKNNHASGTNGEGGAAIHASGINGPMNLTVDNCFFTGNTSQGSAGAIYADGWKRSSYNDEDMPDHVKVSNCTFYENKSAPSSAGENSTGGGAIYPNFPDHL
jgi:hypothetical protein